MNYLSRMALNDATLQHDGIKWGAYGKLDAAWKSLISTGPKWFMDRVWQSGMHFVRVSNAWPYESDASVVTFHPRRKYPNEEGNDRPGNTLE